MTYDEHTNRMKHVFDALLSIPVAPRETFQERLARAAGEADNTYSERDLWKAAQDDPELKHRVNAIHAWMCSLKLSELTEVIDHA